MPNWFRALVVACSVAGLFVAWRWQVDLEPSWPLVTIVLSFLAGVLVAWAVQGEAK